MRACEIWHDGHSFVSVRTREAETRFYHFCFPSEFTPTPAWPLSEGEYEVKWQCNAFDGILIEGRVPLPPPGDKFNIDGNGRLLDA
jgi:hypothetical protein